MRVLVTGATGFVATHLVPALAPEHDVVALGHDPSRIVAADGVEPLVVDLRRAEAAELPDDVDAVVHLAQANAPFPDGALDLLAVNTTATVALLEHARRCGASRFLYASSGSVYGPGERSWREDDRPTGRDFYAATKLAGERFVDAYEPYLATTILRLVTPYGPGQQNRLIPRLIASVREGRRVTLNDGGRPRMNPIFVDDVVRLIVAALARPSGAGIVNVAGDETASIAELADAAGRAVGRQPVFEAGSQTVAGDLVCDNRRLHELVGPEPLVGIEDGILRTTHALVRS